MQHAGPVPPIVEVDDTKAAQIMQERRYSAITLFVGNPGEAAVQYPDLIAELCTFVQSSTNPYSSGSDGVIRQQLQYEQWEHAKQWADQQHPDVG